MRRILTFYYQDKITTREADCSVTITNRFHFLRQAVAQMVVLYDWSIWMMGVGLICPQEEVEEAQGHLNFEDGTCPSFLIAGKKVIWVSVCLYKVHIYKGKTGEETQHSILLAWGSD